MMVGQRETQSQRSTHSWGPEGGRRSGKKDVGARELGSEVSVVSSVDSGRREKKLPGLSTGELGMCEGLVAEV